MYELYIWYPWEFGRWIDRGKFKTKKELYEALGVKSRVTYKVVKSDVVIEYHEAPQTCWRKGMVRPTKPEIIQASNNLKAEDE